MSSSAGDRAATRIFDLIDARKIGLAEGVLEETLPKFPDHHAVLAAEALVLLNKKEIDKAKEKAEALSEQNVLDAKAINALVYVLQQCCSWPALARTYERLRHIQNERTVLENLVQTYVRMGSYEMVQKTSLQLYRKWNDPRYQVWAVQANLSQVPIDSTDHILLKLSTRILNDVILTENGLITPSTSRMYVEVLNQQKLYNETINFLCSSRGVAVGLPEIRLELLAKTLFLNADLARSNAVAKNLWNRQPDNWNFVELYLNSLSESNKIDGVLELDGPSENKREIIQLSESDCTLSDALQFCRYLISKVTLNSNNRPCRGPFMAELEILYRQSDKENLQKLTLNYAKRFYRVTCCFLDISTYLDLISASSIYSWSIEDITDIKENELHYHTKKILGLRCHVAMWSETRDQQPNDESVEKLIQDCLTAYNKAKSLSIKLNWNEEGLCDGYITVILNIVLHLYHSTKNINWIEKGLSILDNVDRKQNNPTWLMYSVCFSRILGFADVESLRQLSFKSVQHDTMSHIGYWPLLSAAVVEEISYWNELAWEHYRSLEKDCSLLRSKVFLFSSWPAMKDIQEYEKRQINSIARIICSVDRIVCSLRSCQTQRNVFDLMKVEERNMTEAFEALQPERIGELRDNTDWLVVKSMILGNIHGEKVDALTNTLVNLPSISKRIEYTLQVLGSLMILHDIALLESHRISVSNAPKTKKNKKSISDSKTEIPLPTLLCQKHTESLLTLPVMNSIAPVLLEFVKLSGNSTNNFSYNTIFYDSLQRTISLETAHNFLFPEALILTTLLQVGTPSKLPIVAWANDLQKALQKVHQGYSSEVEDTLTESQIGKLRAAKFSRIRNLSSDLLRDVIAASRRR